VLALQRAIGNHAVARALSGARLPDALRELEHRDAASRGRADAPGQPWIRPQSPGLNPQRAIGNRAGGRPIAARRAASRPAAFASARTPIAAASRVRHERRRRVARAIAVGESPLPRTDDLPAGFRLWITGLHSQAWDRFVMLNGLRTMIFIYLNLDHLAWDLVPRAPDAPDAHRFPTPLKVTLTQGQLDVAHQNVANQRFASVFQPSTEQIPTHAPGAHQIVPAMLPPPGPGHQWTQANNQFGQPQYGIFSNQLQPPPAATLPLTYGNPAAPSVIMNQGGLNYGMYIQPTGAPHSHAITRGQTTYGGGLPRAPNRVRGHPNRLEDTQHATGPLPSFPAHLAPGTQRTFDNDPLVYTDESDSTKGPGGTSTYRSNKVEKMSIDAGTPFTQINVNPAFGPMGIAQPSQIYFRLPNGAGGYDDRLFDNTGATDYRNVARVSPSRSIRQRWAATPRPPPRMARRASSPREPTSRARRRVPQAAPPTRAHRRRHRFSLMRRSASLSLSCSPDGTAGAGSGSRCLTAAS
jgi:hypothetical protein